MTWNTYDTGEFYLNGTRYAGGIVINQRIQTSFKDGTYNSSNGTSYTATNYSVSTINPLILFGNMSVGGNVAELGKMRLYAFKWYEKNELIFDFVPVRNIYTGEIGLWDNVTQRFFGNSGTGSFLAG